LDVAIGPIIEDNNGTIGADKVTVPRYYYKVLYSESKKNYVKISPAKCFFLKRSGKFVVTVDQIEQKTGIDFFSGLEVKMENKLEGSVSLIGWF
jgi:endonuclease G